MHRATSDTTVLRDVVFEPEPFALGRTPSLVGRALGAATPIRSEPAVDVALIMQRARDDAFEQGRRAALDEFHEREERLCAEAEEAANGDGLDEHAPA